MLCKEFYSFSKCEKNFYWRSQIPILYKQYLVVCCRIQENVYQWKWYPLTASTFKKLFSFLADNCWIDKGLFWYSGCCGVSLKVYCLLNFCNFETMQIMQKNILQIETFHIMANCSVFIEIRIFLQTIVNRDCSV